METIIFAILSALLIFGYVHEDWFIEKEDKAFRLGAAIVRLACKKILQTLDKCGKLEQTKHKEEHHGSHAERVQGLRNPVCQQARERYARRAG